MHQNADVTHVNAIGRGKVLYWAQADLLVRVFFLGGAPIDFSASNVVAVLRKPLLTSTVSH